VLTLFSVLYFICITVQLRSDNCFIKETIDSDIEQFKTRLMLYTQLAVVSSEWAVFYVPTNTVEVIRETVFTGQMTQPTVSKYWRSAFGRGVPKTWRDRQDKRDSLKPLTRNLIVLRRHRQTGRCILATTRLLFCVKDANGQDWTFLLVCLILLYVFVDF